MKRPSFQFYPGDWMQDAALRVVSVGARGAWMDMICIMHQSSPYGYLKVNGKVILVVNLARIIGATLQETEGYLAELKDAGVFSVDDDGCIFSRRMIRDENLRQVRAAGGKSGGNPALKSAAIRLDARLTLEDKQNPTPSSSSSSSSSSGKAKKERAPKGATFPEWIATIADGENAIPEDHHVYRFSKEAGIPDDFVDLAWRWFERKYCDDTKKRYSDWPAVFRRAVENNWGKLWGIDRSTGAYYLTTVGEQLRRAERAT